ncbi:ATP-binding cassette domain-containing protein [Methanosarcina sp. Z-7115]|uniref:ATP-binding cassette domain-containing protein n=1 Tax=Methanosarcina baikalica TaxID=3073890 RepID=A0ABU2CYZ9_9EURY|nr:ATP-binding cassette domain-containing protein [Methanosarcina sp. Z-7115]MDR7664938.1 ATP-binding cassette domain-containing protein [Methanosarcina sp. Z-7115]
MFSISLKADSLSKIYGTGIIGRRRCIFRKVSFEVRPGETFGLMGPSGEGKSTLGRVIAGLEKPTEGTVYYNGSPLSEMKKIGHAAFRRKVQIMFQDPTDAFNPRKKIGRSVSEVLTLLKTPDTEHVLKTKEMLMTIGLSEEVLSRYPSQLSGGQLQRLALGRILLLEPEYIVLDEPTSALDVSVQAQTLHMLKKVQTEKNIGYLLISHDEAVIRFMSGSCGSLENGQLKIID